MCARASFCGASLLLLCTLFSKRAPVVLLLSAVRRSFRKLLCGLPGCPVLCRTCTSVVLLAREVAVSSRARFAVVPGSKWFPVVVAAPSSGSLRKVQLESPAGPDVNYPVGASESHRGSWFQAARRRSAAIRVSVLQVLFVPAVVVVCLPVPLATSGSC